MPEYYEVKVSGHLDQRWLQWFLGMTFTYLDGDETLLSGLLPDQAAIYGLLERMRDLNLTLLSVVCGRPSTQDYARIDEEQQGDKTRRFNHG